MISTKAMGYIQCTDKPKTRMPMMAPQKLPVRREMFMKAVENRDQSVEDEQDESEADEIAGDVAVPCRRLERAAVEDGGLHTGDDHGPEAQLANDLVEGTAGDKPLLVDIGDAVAGGAQKGEEIPLNLVANGYAANRRDLDVVGADQDANAANADDDPDDLRPVVADLEEEEGENDHNDDSPEVDELGAHNGGVAIG